MKMRWTAPGERVAELVTQRQAIYGSELGWVHDGSDIAWDAYDRHSSALLVYDDDGALVASGRFTDERDGASELSDLVDWRAALPAECRALPSAEWSRVMIAPAWRRRGLFRHMYDAMRTRARDAGIAILSGASVAELRPHYEGLGFHYLDLPFRSSFFDDSPIYYPAYQRIA
jgi:GNAT superfamily N-acetyltransferase